MTSTGMRSVALMLLNLLGTIIVSILAYKLFVNALEGENALGVLALLFIGAPFALAYIFAAIFALPYCLRAIRSGIKSQDSLFYALAILAFPFILNFFSSGFLQMAIGISSALLIWSALTALIPLGNGEISLKLK